MKRILLLAAFIPSVVLADGYARGQLQNWSSGITGQGVLGLEYFGATPTITGNTVTIDANDEAGACIFQAPATGSIDAFHWRLTTHTAAGDLDSRAESVDATDGDYSGTLLDTNTNCTITTSGTGVITCDFTAEPSVTKGQIIAAVLERQSGTANVVLANAPSIGTGHSFPYSEGFVGGVMTKQSNRACNVAVEYSGSTPYYPILNVWPAAAINTLTVASNTSPDEVGNLFNFPYPIKACGAKLSNNNASTVDFDIKLWDSNQTTALATFNVDGNIQGSSANLENGIYMFSSPVALRANTNYYLTVVPTTTTGQSFYDIQVGTAAQLNQLNFGGSRAYKVYREDGASTFSTDTSRLAWIDLIQCGALGSN